MSNPAEIADLTTLLDRHRAFLLQTAQGLTDEQARTASTVSVLTIASILKHVADTEEQWMAFAERGAEAVGFPYEGGDASDGQAQEEPDWGAGVDPRFVLSDNETLDVLRERVLEVGRRTTELLGRLDLDAAHELPPAPWFQPGESWSVRRVAVHMIAEIAQHSGHADIIREAIDGQRTMG